MITEAKSGHPGGSLSATEIVVTLFFDVLRHDPANPKWPDRDRFILSKGHCCPILYAVMAECGYCPKDQLNTLRKLGSIYQGHPDVRFIPALEASTGSLGRGIVAGDRHGAGGAAGPEPVAHLRGAGRRRNSGRPDLGSGHVRRLHTGWTTWWPSWTTTGIQLDGFVKDIMELEPLADKWRSFGWHVIEVDGHDIAGAAKSLRAKPRRTKDKPTCIIAHTIKGKGVSFMENNPKFHGTAPTHEECALGASGACNDAGAQTKYELKLGAATREAFGKALVELGAVESRRGGARRRSVEVHLHGRIRQEVSRPVLSNAASPKRTWSRSARVWRRSGKIPFVSSFSAFVLNKGFEQLRVTAAFPHVNLKVVGTHSGISIGEDGPSQMSIEDIEPGLLAGRIRGDLPGRRSRHDEAGESRGGLYRTAVHPRRPRQGSR